MVFSERLQIECDDGVTSIWFGGQCRDAIVGPGGRPSPEELARRGRHAARCLLAEGGGASSPRIASPGCAPRILSGNGLVLVERGRNAAGAMLGDISRHASGRLVGVARRY